MPAITINRPEDLAPLDSVTSALGMGLMLIDRQMRVAWANELVQADLKAVGRHQPLHCFQRWERTSKCADCLPVLVFRTGEASEGLRERGANLPGGNPQAFRVRAIPVHDARGEHTWVLESLVKLSSVELLNIRGWGDGKLRMSAETAGAYLVLDREDRIVSWGPSAAALLGWPDPEEVLGRSVDLIIPEERLEEKQRLREQVMREGMVTGVVTERRHKAGHLVPVTLSARVLRDEEGRYVGCSTLLEDRSVLLTLRKQLEMQRQFSTYLARQRGEAIICLDAQDKVISWNPGAQQLLGFEVEQIMGQPFSLFAGEEASRQLLDRIRSEGGVSGQRVQWRDRKGGRMLALEVTATVLKTDEGEPLGTGLVATDISERLREERRMIRSEKMAAVGSLAAGLAHEIGTPLNVISATAEYLLGDLPPQSPGADELHGIVGETDRISKLVNELLTFARGSTSQWQLVDPEESIRRAVRLTRIPMQKKGIEVDMRLSEELAPVRMEPDGLHQILLNLLLNASHEVPRGGQISVRARREPSRQGGVGDMVVVEVCDSGPGVPSEQRERIFDPFYTTRADGTGLGLAVCAKIVASHGGDIRVTESDLGGANFVVYLPVAVEEERDG